MGILSKEEEDLLYRLTEKMTGSSQTGYFKKDLIVRNVEKRILQIKCSTFHNYLKIVSQNSDELEQLISNMTIHTTSWFREQPHYDELKKIAVEHHLKNKGVFKVWSAACSTGEEVYSCALVLESIRSQYADFEYMIYGSDIDRICLEVAKNSIYKKNQIEHIPQEYHQFLLVGEYNQEPVMTVSESILQRCHFFSNNLIENSEVPGHSPFQVIFCRNVLIYFNAETQLSIVSQLAQFMSSEGTLILGHSDSFTSHSQLKMKSGSIYLKSSQKLSVSSDLQITSNLKSNTTQSLTKQKILVVDDSPTLRKVLNHLLNKDYEVFEVSSAEAATEILTKHNFSLITLDLNMPGENGVSWLKRQRQMDLKIPVLIISDSTQADAIKIFGALENGAQDYITKSRLSSESDKVLELVKQLTNFKNEKNEIIHYNNREFKMKNFKPEVILIGASTGGPEAIAKLIAQFPKPCLPIIVVQHISHEFSNAFGQRLSHVSGLGFGEIEPSQSLMRNTIYLAKGDYHITLKKISGQIFIETDNSVKVNGHRPSVDKLFNSCANLDIQTISVLLTGMGADGAEGLLHLAKTNKTYTIAQDKESSVVFGMPKKAIELNAANAVGNLFEIRNKIIELMTNAFVDNSKKSA